MSEQDVLVAQGRLQADQCGFVAQCGYFAYGYCHNQPFNGIWLQIEPVDFDSPDFEPTLLNDPRQIEDYATRVEVRQPLLNFDGIYQRKAAKAKLTATEMKADRTNDYLDLEVDKAYMQLQLAYKTVRGSGEGQRDGRGKQAYSREQF